MSFSNCRYITGWSKQQPFICSLKKKGEGKRIQEYVQRRLEIMYNFNEHTKQFLYNLQSIAIYNYQPISIYIIKQNVR